MREEHTAATAEDMRALGRQLARLLRAGDLVILSGPLGAGKTTLVQGIADGLGVLGTVTSPTFVIARVHRARAGGPDLVHADAYRLASPAEVDDLDLDATVDNSVTVLEWGGGLAEGLAPGRLEIAISPTGQLPRPGGHDEAGPDNRPRTVRITGHGERWAASHTGAAQHGEAAQDRRGAQHGGAAPDARGARHREAEHDRGAG